MNQLAAFLRISGLALLPSISILAQPAPTQGIQGRTIVFVCEHGSAKSTIAAAHFNAMANKSGLPYRAIARGVHPDKEIPPHVKSGLAAEGLDIRGWQPKRFSDGDALRADRVITLGMYVANRKIGCGARGSGVERCAIPERKLPKCKPRYR
jgi:hypothetical protein